MILQSGALTVALSSEPEWGYEIRIAPAIDWIQMPSGRWFGEDLGAALDSYECSVVWMGSRAEAAALRAFLLGSRGAETTWTVGAGVYPFGPHVGELTAGARVRIREGWRDLGRIALAADLYGISFDAILLDRPASSTGTLATLLARGTALPRPTTQPSYAVLDLDDGSATAWDESGDGYACDLEASLTTAQAAAACRAWLGDYRAQAFAWTPPAGAYPFGAELAGPLSVKLLRLSASHQALDLWSVRASLVRA